MAVVYGSDFTICDISDATAYGTKKTNNRNQEFSSGLDEKKENNIMTLQLNSPICSEMCHEDEKQ